MIKQLNQEEASGKYLPKEVEEKSSLISLKAQGLPHPGINTQPWDFIIVRSQKRRRSWPPRTTIRNGCLSAPVFLICVADIRCKLDNTDGIRLDEYSPEPELKLIIRDTAIAITHILLEAENQGLASCWTGWYKQRDVRAILNIPDDKYVCGIVTLGYGAHSPKPRPRKSMEEMIRYEKWQ
jgi:nitroreductase